MPYSTLNLNPRLSLIRIVGSVLSLAHLRSFCGCCDCSNYGSWLSDWLLVGVVGTLLLTVAVILVMSEGFIKGAVA